MNVEWNTNRWGAPQIDSFKPFGNMRDPAEEVGRILKWEMFVDIWGKSYMSKEQYRRGRLLYSELEEALSIVLKQLPLTNYSKTII